MLSASPVHQNLTLSLGLMNRIDAIKQAFISKRVVSRLKPTCTLVVKA
jgi:hypothetical protein